MTPDDRRQATDLDRHWDAFALEGAPPELSALDRETAELLSQLWSWSAPPQSATVRGRIWQRIQDQQEEEGSMFAPALTQLHHLLSEAMLAPTGRAAPPAATHHPVSRWKGFSANLATAAVLVLALAVGLFAAGSWPRSWRTAEPSGLPAVVVAPATPATTAAQAATLLDVIIPEEQLPRGERVSSIFEYATSPAGSTGRWLPANSAGQPGLRVHHMVEGSTIVRADDASQVVRAGGSTPEDVAAGAEVTLQAGDTWIARNETAFDAVNPNDTPARVLIWVLANVEDPGAVLNYPVPSTWTEDNYTLDQPAPGAPGLGIPTGSIRLRIQRIELEPKESYPPPAQGLQYGLASPFKPDGSPIIGPSVAAQPSGKVVNVGRKPATAYVLNIASAD